MVDFLWRKRIESRNLISCYQQQRDMRIVHGRKQNRKEILCTWLLHLYVFICYAPRIRVQIRGIKTLQYLHRKCRRVERKQRKTQREKRSDIWISLNAKKRIKKKQSKVWTDKWRGWGEKSLPLMLFVLSIPLLFFSFLFFLPLLLKFWIL